MVSHRYGSAAATEEEIAELDLRWYRVLFSVQRSIRYHSRRESFFSRWHRVNGFISVVLGTATVAAVTKAASVTWAGPISLIAPAAITCFGALDLVFGFAERAKQHGEFRRRFISIETCMAQSANEDQLKSCVSDRLAIEASEPPKMFALDVLCHNELLRAQGYEQDDPDHAKHFRSVTWFQRLTANMWPWEGSDFPSIAWSPRKKGEPKAA